jgi:competence protein ComEA
MLGFTQEERKVLLFLIGACLLGVGADFLLKRYASMKSSAGFAADLGKVNLNTADKQALMDIPGVGERLAERIIASRDKQAGFGSVEDLRGIKGISEEKLERIKEYITVR